MRNKLYTRQRTPLPDGAIRKQPADSVPYGENISRNGKHVWCAYLNGQLVGVAATADEARPKYAAALKVAEAKARAERKARDGGGHTP